MGDKLQPANAPKTDAFSMIVKYMQAPGDMELSPDAERMLKRLMYADTLMRANKKTSDEVCKDLQETFTISEFTALRDIKNAQKLFAQARQISKQYLAHLHLERINKDIEETRERLFWMENDEMPGVKFPRVPDAKELAALAKLHGEYSYILNTAPEEKKENPLPPPIFNFILVKGAAINTGMSVQDALAGADKLLGAPTTPVDLPDDADDAEWNEVDDSDEGLSE